MVTEALSSLSNVFIYVAMGFYAAAFIAYALDLARRGAQATAAEVAAVPSAVERRAAVGATMDARGVVTATAATTATAAVGGGSSGVSSALGRVSSRLSSRVEEDTMRAASSSRSIRWAFVLTGAGFAFHILATVSRGIAAARVPWANMWEFSMTGTLLIIAVFLVANVKWDIRYLGTFIVGLVLVLQGVALLRYYVPVVPLQPALQSYWLVIHIVVAALATGCFAIGFALACLQLLQHRRERRAAESLPQGLPFLKTLPHAAALENLSYRITIVGFIAWTFTLIAGAIWADKAWGSYWGWDTKEVWTFIVWILYAGYIHARATRGWRGSRSAYLSIIGFATVLFNFGVVNVFFHGLHAYSGL